MYCTNCNKNIGYLCYVTYDKLDLHYECNCGSKGRALLDFVDSADGSASNSDMITINNRMCCPKDESPLITLLDKNITGYELKITCKKCGKVYDKKMT